MMEVYLSTPPRYNLRKDLQTKYDVPSNRVEGVYQEIVKAKPIFQKKALLLQAEKGLNASDYLIDLKESHNNLLVKQQSFVTQPQTAPQTTGTYQRQYTQIPSLSAYNTPKSLQTSLFPAYPSTLPGVQQNISSSSLIPEYPTLDPILQRSQHRSLSEQLSYLMGTQQSLPHSTLFVTTDQQMNKSLVPTSDQIKSLADSFLDVVEMIKAKGQGKSQFCAALIEEAQRLVHLSNNPSKVQQMKPEEWKFLSVDDFCRARGFESDLQNVKQIMEEIICENDENQIIQDEQERMARIAELQEQLRIRKRDQNLRKQKKDEETRRNLQRFHDSRKKPTQKPQITPIPRSTQTPQTDGEKKMTIQQFFTQSPLTPSNEPTNQTQHNPPSTIPTDPLSFSEQNLIQDELDKTLENLRPNNINSIIEAVLHNDDADEENDKETNPTKEEEQIQNIIATETGNMGKGTTELDDEEKEFQPSSVFPSSTRTDDDAAQEELNGMLGIEGDTNQPPPTNPTNEDDLAKLELETMLKDDPADNDQPQTVFDQPHSQPLPTPSHNQGAPIPPPHTPSPSIQPLDPALFLTPLPKPTKTQPTLSIAANLPLPTHQYLLNQLAAILRFNLVCPIIDVESFDVLSYEFHSVSMWLNQVMKRTKSNVKKGKPHKQHLSRPEMFDSLKKHRNPEQENADRPTVVPFLAQFYLRRDSAQTRMLYLQCLVSTGLLKQEAYLPVLEQQLFSIRERMVLMGIETSQEEPIQVSEPTQIKYGQVLTKLAPVQKVALGAKLKTWEEIVVKEIASL
ncbi:hypothetical protein BLNAU_10855 [Blattamonas nauphoetae]|uniref:Uncharacterized protein n=1 Tax=Blattamonas nauphoetae TaxID=2049346 RepID=A0ABQ9XRD3_9EUKA|nr:hypothetical protein BLNAU_10855 [Blattamonas nauphoetae]